MKEYSKTQQLMGTYVTVTVYGRDETKLASSVNKSFAEMKRVADVLSHYSKTNSVHRLNNAGANKPVTLEPELSEVLKKSLHYSNISGGAFDVTVKPLLDLWSQVADTGKMPEDVEVAEAKERVGYNKLVLDEASQTAAFTQDGMAVTLGGIAKGYVADKGIKALKGDGIQHALINAGGDMRAFGGKPGGEPWRIALKNPRNESDHITVIKLADGAVATSGDYERYYTPNKKVHHIVDPRTGYSATGLISVTITAPQAVDADALATTVFVLGPTEGLKLVEQTPDVEALVITENLSIHKSSGFI